MFASNRAWHTYVVYVESEDFDFFFKFSLSIGFFFVYRLSVSICTENNLIKKINKFMCKLAFAETDIKSDALQGYVNQRILQKKNHS